MAPDAHSLDLRLMIDRGLVLIDVEKKAQVLDHDLLIAEFDRLAGELFFEILKRLMTRSIETCATYS